jgi:Uri superfamily endonuclease
LKRHLNDKKKLFWHIDYLLNSENAKTKEIVFVIDSGRWECILAEDISNNGAEIINFGCSDCKCKSHLFYFKNSDMAIESCVNSFKKLSLTPKRLEDLMV